jgi:3-hydroxyacyl-CoA dehydrogenase
MTVNVLGYGVMARQIAALFYLGGFNVVIWNHRQVQEGEFSRHINLLKRYINAEGAEGTIKFTYDLDKLEEAVTIECIIEDLKEKKKLYAALSKKNARPYFTNSSSYSPQEIGEQVNGFHFFNPVTTKLVELFTRDKSVIEQIRPLITFLEGIGFEVIPVHHNRGYIGNFILFHEISSLFKLIEKHGYSAESTMRVYNKIYNNSHDVFTVIDHIGIDVVYKILINLREMDESFYVPSCLKTALEKNVLGKKNKTSIRQIL